MQWSPFAERDGPEVAAPCSAQRREQEGGCTLRATAEQFLLPVDSPVWVDVSRGVAPRTKGVLSDLGSAASLPPGVGLFLDMQADACVCWDTQVGACVSGGCLPSYRGSD